MGRASHLSWGSPMRPPRVRQDPPGQGTPTEGEEAWLFHRPHERKFTMPTGMNTAALAPTSDHTLARYLDRPTSKCSRSARLSPDMTSSLTRYSLDGRAQ